MSNPYNGLVQRPLLTILIPTRNRLEQLNALLLNLLVALRNFESVEIVVSDNSDLRPEDIHRDPKIRVIRPDQVQETAEENLFFGINHANGTYIWPLGDDDVVLPSGVQKLISECEIGRFDAFTMNTRNVTHDYQSMGWSRVMCFQEIVALPYKEFLERIGYWSIPAGISLTIFKKELISEELLISVKNLESKIYSHVTFYASILKDKEFAFINVDIVEYRTNLYDVSHESTSHWKTYSSKKNLHDRYFWLNGFVNHLKYLEDLNAIGPDFLRRCLDIGHFNHRLPLLEHMISMFIDQLLLDLHNKSVIPISTHEAIELLDYFQQKEPSLIGYYSDIRSIHSSSVSAGERIQTLENLKEKWNRERAIYPYRRFYFGRVYGHLIYDTPLGWLALPQKTSSTTNGVPSIDALEQMMLGIDFPPVVEIHSALTKDDLFTKIKETVLKEETLSDTLKIQLAPAKFKSNNKSDVPTNTLKRIWSLLPLRLKIYVRNSIYGR